MQEVCEATGRQTREDLKLSVMWVVMDPHTRQAMTMQDYSKLKYNELKIKIMEFVSTQFDGRKDDPMNLSLFGKKEETPSEPSSERKSGGLR